MEEVEKLVVLSPAEKEFIYELESTVGKLPIVEGLTRNNFGFESGPILRYLTCCEKIDR